MALRNLNATYFMERTFRSLNQVPEVKYRTPKVFFFPRQVSYDGELHKHPQLEADLTAVREIYGPNAVSLRYDTGLSVLWNL